MAEGYADSGHIFSVDFNRKVIVYWWLSAMFALTVSFIGIPLLIIWLPFGWLVHRKQFEHLACALTNRSINIRMDGCSRSSRTYLSTCSLTSKYTRDQS